jgi:AraC family transcriptional regulator, regulatory protein of adaptative response / DNA-3-methyladenine glycosylase II
MFLDAAVCHRALDSRDARFDGVFFVGITSTNIYCRPICPARISYPNRRRFFANAPAAESAGYRPCLRCRPELAPGLALCYAVSQLARAAALRIAGGALNGNSVSALAREFDVSERHLRRSMSRELGLSPNELAQSYRLLLAKKLLGETALPVTRVAYASGFQSLRRFNSVFRERYALSPSAVRRARIPARAVRSSGAGAAPALMSDAVHLSLGYRAPFAWESLLDVLRREAVQGVEFFDAGHYARTVSVDGQSGVIAVDDDACGGTLKRATKSQLNIALSPSLLPALMPLLVRLRQLFDLDSEPLLVDAHLENMGLRSFVRRRPGLRIPGAMDGFEIALRVLVGGTAPSQRARLARIVRALGEPIESGHPELVRLMPDAVRVIVAGESGLRALGAPARAARALVAIARESVAGRLVLDPSADSDQTHRTLMAIDGVSELSAREIVMRALHGPDAFPFVDRALVERAKRWRPWRAYATWHLRVNDFAADSKPAARNGL